MRNVQPRDPTQQQKPVVPHDVADRQQPFGGGGQCAPLAHLPKNVFELRYEEHDQHRHDEDADDRQEQRVSHRAHGPPLDVVLGFGELGHPAEHFFEKAAFAAGADHADRHFTEDIGEAGHGVGQRGPILHLVMHLLEDRAQPLVLGLLLQHRQGPQQRHAAPQKVGQLPIHDREQLGRHAADLLRLGYGDVGRHFAGKQRLGSQLRHRIAAACWRRSFRSVSGRSYHGRRS